MGISYNFNNMGIEGFKTFLDKYCPNSVKKSKLSYYKGTRVAIDGHNWMNKYMAVAQKEIVNKTDVGVKDVDHEQVVKSWLLAISKFLTNLVAVGVTPVFVIDGPPLEDKEATRAKRSSTRGKAREKLEKLEESMKIMGPLAITPDMIEEKRKHLRQLYYISSEDIDSLRDVLYAFGIPNIKSRDDAEKLCTSLCIEGYVSAVLSTDTDNFTFGCPRMIKEIDRVIFSNLGVDATITVIELNDILNESGMTQSQFVDFCILSGCDYNEKIKGIGPVGARDRMIKHIRLENVGEAEKKKGKSIDCLRYNRCREIFAYESSRNLLHEGEELELDEQSSSGWDSQLDVNMQRLLDNTDIIENYGLRPEFHRYLPYIRSLPTPSSLEPIAIDISIYPSASSSEPVQVSNIYDPKVIKDVKSLGIRYDVYVKNHTHHESEITAVYE